MEWVPFLASAGTLVLALALAYRPLGDYMAWVFQTRTHWAPERVSTG